MIDSLDVVLADGSLVTASATSNPDLFWAMRGAGSSFGIVTAFHLKTYAAPNANIVFQYNFNWPNYTVAAKALDTIQRFGNTQQPREMNLRLLFQSYSTQLLGVYYGSRADFNSSIEPLLKALPNRTSSSVTTKNWIDTLSTYSYGALQQPLNYDVHAAFVSLLGLSDCLLPSY
jgi:hypothetical protein